MKKIILGLFVLSAVFLVINLTQAQMGQKDPPFGIDVRYPGGGSSILDRDRSPFDKDNGRGGFISMLRNRFFKPRTSETNGSNVNCKCDDPNCLAPTGGSSSGNSGGGSGSSGNFVNPAVFCRVNNKKAALNCDVSRNLLEELLATASKLCGSDKTQTECRVGGGCVDEKRDVTITLSDGTKCSGFSQIICTKDPYCKNW